MKEKPKCVECGKGTTIIFSILGVSLCRNCRRDIEKYRCITKTRAIKEYCLKENELYALECEEKTNPHYAIAAPMMLFLKTQIKELALKKWGNLENLEKETLRRKELGEKIKQGKAEAKRLREEELIEALGKKDLVLRSDSKLCRLYINGKTLYDIDEVVEIMAEANERHTETPYDKLWDKYHKEIEKDAEEAYYNYGNWTDAWDETTAWWREKILEEAYAMKNNSNLKNKQS